MLFVWIIAYTTHNQRICHIVIKPKLYAQPRVIYAKNRASSIHSREPIANYTRPFHIFGWNYFVY